MVRGRPSKYDPKFCKEVDKYLAENQDEEIKVVKQINTDKGYEMYDNKLKVRLPTIGGFALFINTPERTVYDWRDEHEDFSQSLEKIVKEQERRLINLGLSGDYNSTIAKLILSSNHGMAEKSETDVTSKGQQIQGVATILDKAYGSGTTDTDTTQ